MKLHYPDGCCPDCGEPIPDDCVDGQACSNCEHAFFYPKFRYGQFVVALCDLEPDVPGDGLVVPKGTIGILNHRNDLPEGGIGCGDLQCWVVDWREFGRCDVLPSEMAIAPDGWVFVANEGEDQDKEVGFAEPKDYPNAEHAVQKFSNEYGDGDFSVYFRKDGELHSCSSDTAPIDFED